MIKNKIKIISILLISFLVIEVFAPAVIFASTTGTVSGDVNIRQSASSSSTRLGELTTGTNITINGTSGDWYNITLKAYAAKNYINSQGKVTGAVNIRESANSSSKRLGELTTGTTVTINSTSGDWYNITIKGYVSKNYVTTSGNTPTVKTETKKTTTSQSSGSILDIIIKIIKTIVDGIIKMFSNIGKPSIPVISDNNAVTSVTLNNTNITMSVGDTKKLTATVSPSNASNKEITWTSSNSKVAKINGGTVTAVAEGSATITAKSSNGKTAKCVVNVKNSSGIIDQYVKYTFSGRGRDYYGLTDDEVKTFAAVLMGEVPATNSKRVFWCASVMFNRIDANYYNSTDAMKILTKGWSEVYNNGSYKKNLDKIPNNVLEILEEVINGKRAHKYIDFGCGQSEINRVKNSGKKYEIIAEDIYYDWRESLK